MIRLASQDEAIEILNEPQNCNRIGLVTEKLIYQPWMVELKDKKMMFVFWMLDKDVCEVHIACKKDSILKCREMSKEVLDFLFSYKVNRVITNCPEGKIANLARKMGMTEYDRIDNKVYFEVLSWV